MFSIAATNAVRLTSIWMLLCLQTCSMEVAPGDALCLGSDSWSDNPQMEHLIGFNAYYLQEEATRSLRKARVRDESVLSAPLEEVLRKAVALGVSVIRSNGHNDDVQKAGDSAIQIDKLQFDETALQGLDLVVHRACEHGIRLLLTLGNHWDAYGGTRQYLKWNGISDADEGDSRFYTDEATIEHYKEYIQTLLTRKNHFDGIRYFEHPAIWGWELLNEPRGSGGRGLGRSGAPMRKWVDEIAKKIKSLSPDKLVSTGEEGFDNTYSNYDRSYWKQKGVSWMFTQPSSFQANSASPYIDLASIHMYPEAHGYADTEEQALSAGCKYIEEHAVIAQQLGKALILGEFGLPNDGRFTLDQRRRIYAGWFDCAVNSGAALTAPWMFANDSRPDEWDRYSFYYRDGSRLEDPENSYADLIYAAAHRTQP